MNNNKKPHQQSSASDINQLKVGSMDYHRLHELVQQNRQRRLQQQNNDIYENRS